MIKVSHLTKYYGDHSAVEDLEFTLKEGSVTGFLGPNGAGKSTTLNMITGFLSPSEGAVYVDGMELLKEPEQVKKRIGYLPEVPPLYPELTVWEHLVFAVGLKKMPRSGRDAACAHVLEELGLSEVRDRLAKNLSKGFRQRLGFAMALVGEPDILILDEPTAGLDPRQIIEVRDLIRSLKKDHTVLVSSHILSEIAEVCDSFLIIHEGVLVADGTLEELRKETGGETLEQIFLRLTSKEPEVTP